MLIQVLRIPDTEAYFTFKLPTILLISKLRYTFEKRRKVKNVQKKIKTVIIIKKNT